MKTTHKKGMIIILVTVGATGLFFWFWPRPLRNMLGQEEATNRTMYYTWTDMTDMEAIKSVRGSGPVSEVLSQAGLFWSLFNNVTVSGPFFYKNGAVNADYINLSFSFPQNNEGYRQVVMEIIMSKNIESGEVVHVYINVGNQGYLVTSGKSYVVQFIQNMREIAQ